jgi:hypothetical protein
MRTSVERPYWVRLRELLRERGINPDEAVMAQSFPDDARLEFGIVVTPEGRVVEFDFDYLRVTEGEGSFTAWTDVSDRWEGGPWAQEIATALGLIEDERSSASST